MTTLNKNEAKIASMFDAIAPTYDRLNHILSLNIDMRWRKKLIKELHKSNPNEILDLACGTGDLSLMLSKSLSAKVVGIDISKNMLEIARQKCGDTLDFKLGSAENLPFNNASFDAVTISFGVRNFEKRERCLREIYRVLMTNGTLAILEFSMPQKSLLRTLYRFYFMRILPLVGGLISKNRSAYTYLPESTIDFPSSDDFSNELLAAGFNNVRSQSLSGGIAYIYLARKT